MSSTSAMHPLTTWDLVKMTGPIILFGILFPTVDNLTDLRMIIRLYEGIPGCNHIYPWDYVRETNGTWEDLYTCQPDPDTYCQLNDSKSKYCDFFYRYRVPGPVRSLDIPKCTWDYDTCKSDPATFCEDNPHRLTCGRYQHVKFATMFLGIFYPLTAIINNENLTHFSAICVELFLDIFNVVQTRNK